MSFYTKLGHGTCAMHCIPCACLKCTPEIDQLWTQGVPPHQQPRYRPVKYFLYWPVLGYLNNWNIIHFSHKTKSSEEI